jgi:RNA polymerase sigma-70 factor (ECF subfamily)
MSLEETNPILPDGQQLLIKGCIAGDRASQQKLYNLYARKMMGVCLWYARNREEAEEILQDGFMRVFTYLHKYTGEGSFEGWIRKIMVNAALFKYRNKSQLRAVVEYNAETHDATETASVIEMLDAKELVKLVQTLTPGYRMVFNLYVLEGMKHREIAAILGISEGTSKSNLADARVILQKVLTSQKKTASL